ncbi:MAG TPA: hypothetical protein VFB59_03470, partial [Candidatus Saccharimonadales bacterium]|nr:hypothetical protein [Candidatus Saccharimonadales bacterium]
TLTQACLFHPQLATITYGQALAGAQQHLVALSRLKRLIALSTSAYWLMVTLVALPFVGLIVNLMISLGPESASLTGDLSIMAGQRHFQPLLTLLRMVH